MVTEMRPEMGLQRPKPIEIQVDNSTSISFQTKMCPDSKLKGCYDLRWNWIRELQDTTQVKTVKVNTLYNIADLLTKCHSRVTYNRLILIPMEKSQLVASRSTSDDIYEGAQ